jgi:plastocyanin
MKRLFLGLGLVVLAVAATACSGATAAPATDGPTTPTSGDATIVAKDLKFQTTSVTVPAGKPLAIVFENQEGAPHNIDIKDASGAGVFKGEVVSSTTVTYQVPALAAGTYSFLCDVHPDMKGTITVQ